jgi:hypothetical protein
MALLAPQRSRAESWSSPASCAVESCTEVNLDDDEVVAVPTRVGDLDAASDYRKRIRRTGIAGQCLQVRVIPYSVPAQGQPVYLAYLYHSGEVSP